MKCIKKVYGDLWGKSTILKVVLGNGSCLEKDQDVTDGP